MTNKRKETFMKTILFQGDSITDCSRSRDNIKSLGTGYPNLVTSHLSYEHPGEFNYINKGISGNRIVDLYARIKADIINLEPDYMSILIGVNDVWHEISSKNGVDADKFEKIYSMLIEEVISALPNIKIAILEPYVLEGEATKNTEDNPEKWHTFRSEVEKRASAAKRIAEKYGLTFIALQDKLDKAAEKTGSSEHWLRDGVHPDFGGHELIARAWLEGFKIS